MYTGAAESRLSPATSHLLWQNHNQAECSCELFTILPQSQAHCSQSGSTVSKYWPRHADTSTAVHWPNEGCRFNPPQRIHKPIIECYTFQPDFTFILDFRLTITWRVFRWLFSRQWFAQGIRYGTKWLQSKSSTVAKHCCICPGLIKQDIWTRYCLLLHCPVYSTTEEMLFNI